MSPSAHIDEGRLFGRGLAFPPRIGPDGRVAFSEGAQNIREAIQIILLTEWQERVMRPEFGGGLRSFLFRPNTVATHRLIEERVERALSRWEPRIRVEEVTARAAPDAPEAAVVTVRYRLVATGTPNHLSLTVQLTGAS
ncbi:phage tail protein [Rhodothermaceae bacterium RA]|nr:phage tail protein [Rhodothermaceae bacterium RA]